MEEQKIPYDDWAKIELRIATIINVKPHPNAEKLYILTLDLGDKKKELVAGIREVYTEEELLGKQIAVFVNLEPKVIRGVLSEGMILAASDGVNKPAIVTVEHKVNNNAKIR